MESYSSTFQIPIAEVSSNLIALDCFMVRIGGNFKELRFVANARKIIFVESGISHHYFCHFVGLRKKSFYEGEVGDAGVLRYEFTQAGFPIRVIEKQSNLMSTAVLMDMAIRRTRLMGQLGPGFQWGILTTSVTFQKPETLQR